MDAAKAHAFEWDAAKNASNIKKHGIDFDDALAVFDSTPDVFRSDRSGEERYVAVGLIESGMIVAVIFTIRGDRYRIISARKARADEKRKYRHQIVGRASKR